MKYFLYVILAVISLVACHNAKKDQKSVSGQIENSLKVKVIKEVQQKDSLQKRLEDRIYKNWVECDSMPYFILDRQIKHLLKNPKLDETEKLVLNYRLVYYYYYRRFIYDSIQYQNKAIDLLVKTLNSDKDLFRSSVYFKTTPEKTKKYLTEVENAQTNKEKDSLVWNKLNSDKRLSDY